MSASAVTSSGPLGQWLAMLAGVLLLHGLALWALARLPHAPLPKPVRTVPIAVRWVAPKPVVLQTPPPKPKPKPAPTPAIKTPAPKPAPVQAAQPVRQPQPPVQQEPVSKATTPPRQQAVATKRSQPAPRNPPVQQDPVRPQDLRTLASQSDQPTKAPEPDPQQQNTSAAAQPAAEPRAQQNSSAPEPKNANAAAAKSTDLASSPSGDGRDAAKPDATEQPRATKPKAVQINAVAFLQQVAPDYPESARNSGDQGRCMVRVLIDPNGRVTQATVVKPSGSKWLDRAAIKAAEQSTFAPYRENGQPIAVMVDIPYDFKLDE